jgi:hypothetical protein
VPTLTINRVRHAPGNDVVRIEAVLDGTALQFQVLLPMIQSLGPAERRAAVAQAARETAERLGLLGDDLGLTGAVITLP